jgi:transposase-like protein
MDRWLILIVDREGEVLEVFVTKHRNRKAVLQFPERAMKRTAKGNYHRLPPVVSVSDE